MRFRECCVSFFGSGRVSWGEHLCAMAGPPDIHPDLERLVSGFAEAAGLTLAQLRKQDRRPHVARVRGRAARAARVEGYTYREIGQALDRDPTSIVNLCRGKARPERKRPEPEPRRTGRCAAVGL